MGTKTSFQDLPSTSWVICESRASTNRCLKGNRNHSTLHSTPRSSSASQKHGAMGFVAIRTLGMRTTPGRSKVCSTGCAHLQPGSRTCVGVLVLKASLPVMVETQISKPPQVLPQRPLQGDAHRRFWPQAPSRSRVDCRVRGQRCSSAAFPQGVSIRGVFVIVSAIAGVPLVLGQLRAWRMAPFGSRGSGGQVAVAMPMHVLMRHEWSTC